MAVEIHQKEPKVVGEIALEEEHPSKLDHKTPLIQRILTVLRDAELVTEIQEMTVRLCLDEVIVNAIRHGNKFDENKTFRTTLYIQPHTNSWAVRIEDQGAGFDPADVPDVNDPASLLLEGGRGILLISEFMDEIWYYDGGRRVQLTKRPERTKGLWNRIARLFGRGG